MASATSSSPILQASSPLPTSREPQLDLSSLPPIFVSATHFATEDLHTVEDQLLDAGAKLTYDVHEARIVLSKVTRKTRIQFDLRAKGLWTEEVHVAETNLASVEATLTNIAKLNEDVDVVIIDDSSTESEAEDEPNSEQNSTMKKPSRAQRTDTNTAHLPVAAPESLPRIVNGPVVKVIRTDWLAASLKLGHVQPLDRFLSYTGRHIDRPPAEPSNRVDSVRAGKRPLTSPSKSRTSQVNCIQPSSILERAKEDTPAEFSPSSRKGKRKFGHSFPLSIPKSQHAHLLQATTSEYEGESSDLPEPPAWVLSGTKYACQRVSPRTNPNDEFMTLLKKIRLARTLTNDEIGVRAYSTSIAAIAAYPYKINNPKEILRLPGCDAKIANLFVEFANTGKIQAVEDLETDEDLRVLRLFYEIWGVGATTAREFYFDKGWKDLDDIVEYGWSTLSRVQQIGVKYYDEFLDPIPRLEVEEIAQVIHAHAARVRDFNIQSLVVGGYRRGKEACGDVDIIISHPDESKTLNLIRDIVSSLEEEDYITHTLLLSLNNTSRDQQTLPFRAGGGGHGFDSLDKALVVWQDPAWPLKADDQARNPKAKNPAIHRRVDIIISPWRTVGCAVLGWSGGTTFQRDIRRYVKAEFGWKFDSSGLRDRGNGEVVDAEGFVERGRWKSKAKTMEEAERRVFETTGLVYREAEERCTG